MTSPPPDHPGMRWSRRALLVALTAAAFALSLWTALRPDLRSGWLGVGVPHPLVVGLWLVLLVALALQVSSRVPAVVVGMVLALFWPAPVYAAVATMSLYGELATERTTATVVDVDPGRGQGPVLLTVAPADGSTQDAISTLADRGSRTYLVPRVGDRVDVLRDPAGRLPTRTAPAQDSWTSTPAGVLLLTVPGALGLLVLGATAASALTRRESFVMVAGRPEPAPHEQTRPRGAPSA
ncbi:hypothetical protein GCM10009633_24650 [Janibacter melonis]|uniref:hypothetical protein n=1 Tax=Janibacter melonis TaxID=262209 RepID=UPI001E5572AB|nr:hypothetical protein [Janibacter melonis]MCB5990633.1 hypothetical protein [Janibacter melonis]